MTERSSRTQWSSRTQVKRNLVRLFMAVPVSDLFDGVPWSEGDAEGSSLLDNADFTWGDNNASLIAPHRLLDKLSNSGDDHPAVREVRRRIDLLPKNCYIDMEN